MQETNPAKQAAAQQTMANMRITPAIHSKSRNDCNADSKQTLHQVDCGVFSNNTARFGVDCLMKIGLFSTLTVSFLLASFSQAQSCREVIRDATGRIVQTIDRQANGRAVMRDASGKIIGTATTQATGSISRTTYRDANGRITGTASTQHGQSATTRTTYRGPGGQITGTSATNPSNPSHGNPSRTTFRAASGRVTATEQAQGNGRFTTTRRDASGRITETSSGNARCTNGSRSSFQGAPR
ncbi:MAG: hypothetical protein ACNA8L_01000 [Luteolibacter sp.]